MEEFQKIIEEAIEQAEKVDCSIEDYVEGLRLMIVEIERVVDTEKCNPEECR